MQNIFIPFTKAEKEDLFLRTPGERILVLVKQHWFRLAFPLFFTIALAGIAIFTYFIIFLYYFSIPKLFVTTLFLTFLFTSNVITKIIIDWFFHVYVLTNRKVLEVQYSPLFSHKTNEILLDQVRCTEIDIEMEGMVNEIVNQGSVVLTFDRPTHKEACIFENIQNPKAVGLQITNALEFMQRFDSSKAWYKDKPESPNYRFTDLLIPTNQSSIERRLAW